MVSRENVIETNTKCSCGNGDVLTAQKNYFENKCPNCGKEGTLQVETINNVEINNHSVSNEENNENNTTENTTDNSSIEHDAPALKVVCKNCGSEYCGQDGYDLVGGTRSSLDSVNANEITDEEEGEPSSQDENETTYMSGWEGLCDLLKPLDGQAMMVQRGDFVIIKKIEMPQSAKLWAYEGINVVDDSVTITDYTPEIYNTFIIKWGEKYENELEFRFDKHKKLFGERKIVIEAKKVQVAEEESENQGNNDSENKNNEEDKNQEENKFNGSLNDSLFSSSNSQEEMKNLYDGTDKIDTTGDLANADKTGTTGTEQEAPKTEEVPITTKEEAKAFGLAEVGKAKREDGHTIELKVIGNTNFQMGEWCHVRLPSFNEDSYMFISKCSFESSPDNEYINTLTLVDYPPSLGKSKKSKTNDEDAENSDNSDTNTSNSDDSNSDNNNDSNNNSNLTSGNTPNNNNDTNNNTDTTG